ncbi:MAG TPA: hypothetical protein ENK11_04605 [Phycisphaerales bacterium]|nr:hypothetical protein [Phycisphaerales bacterium]
MARRITMLLVSLAAVLVLFGAPASGAPHDPVSLAEQAVDEHTAGVAEHAEAVGGHADADHGGEHGGGGASPIAGYKEALASAVTALVVFGVVSLVLATKVWPMITAGLDERNAKIREEIAAAEAARAQAKAALEEYEQSLSQARVEAQKMLDETRAEQARLAAELKAKADRELNEMREKAKRDIDGAKKAALAEIYAESVNLATRMAGKILHREVTVEDQKRMLDESLAEMTGSSLN